MYSDKKLPGEPVTIAVVGCGQRGKTYALYALQSPHLCKIVAVADPRPQPRAAFVKSHSIDPTLTFPDWKDLHAASADTIKTIDRRLADAVIVAVQDSMHLEVATAFAKQGYHILCEKPMATSIEDCLKMERAISASGVIFGMGHVLRYSPLNSEITAIVKSQELGEIVNIVHVEPVGHYHFAHSYVRGNWAKESESSFSLMTKSCHDIDLICSWLSPERPTRISSFGSLKQFRKSAKPASAGSAHRCLDCPIEKTCPYSAKRIYLDRVSKGDVRWPASVIVDDVPDIENVTHALRTGPYGVCVYESDNDVCDHQVVNMEFTNGATVSFTMVAQTTYICERQTRIHFTHGEIVCDAATNSFTITNFRTCQTNTIKTKDEGGKHGGGDVGLMRSFVEAVRAGNQYELRTDVKEVLMSHLTVFAAECSRKEGRIVDCREFEADVRAESQRCM